jgi:hypothetical protein
VEQARTVKVGSPERQVVKLHFDAEQRPPA